ncbi:MAG: type II toxin-antitoxin system VapC family toxin [Anaerolineales bacterium]|nr:type II toxin-antitoxin system VapC family toxin [Anaerolineales bacterium]
MEEQSVSLTLVDTDILIDAALQVDDAIKCLDSLEAASSLAVSVVTQMELIIGCRNKTELRKLDQFLERFEIIPINERISNIATTLLKAYHLSHGLLTADALIAATAIDSDIDFITKNQRDYRFLEKLKLLQYPKK